MTRLFVTAPFVDFGPSNLNLKTAAPPLQRVRGSRSAVLRDGVRKRCPRQPGVYGMLDTHGDLVYVGKAKNLRARLMSYFRPGSRDPKAGHIVAQARTIIWEPGPDEFAALHRELELIRRWRPRFNVQGKPRKWQHAYVCIGRPPAPYAFLAQRPAERALAIFGPIRLGDQAREAIRRLNDLFQLRDCSQNQEMVFAGQADLFPTERAAGCLRHELGTCSGPCIAACSQSAYRSQVRAVRNYLAGADVTPLLSLERAMKEAAAQQQYERAAVLRDKFEALAWLNRQLEQMRQAKAMGTVIYPLQGHDGIIRWYLLQSGRAVAVVVPSDRSNSPSPDAEGELSALAKEKSKQGRPADWIAGVSLLTSWFRRRPGERQVLVRLDRTER